MIESLLDGLAGLDTHWFLLLAFFLPFGETVALLDAIVPGEVGMVLVGAAAAEAGVPLPVVIVVGALGAFLGDSTSWYIGHRWGYRIITRWEPVHRRLAGPLERAERHFATNGGKTVFVKGLAEGLGVDPARVTSPTFVIANEYPAPGRLLAHVDLYRIESAQELEATGFLDYLEPGAVVAVEWADRFPDALPEDRLELRLLRQTADLIRRAEVSAGGEGATGVLRAWRDALAGQPGVQLAEVE